MKFPSRRSQRRLAGVLLFLNAAAVFGCTGYPLGHIAWSWWTDTDDRAPLPAGAISDSSRLALLRDAEIHRISSEGAAAQIQQIFTSDEGDTRPVVIGGERTSSGGHLFAERPVFLDMRGVDDIVLEEDLVIAGAGTTWSALLEHLAEAGRVPLAAPGLADATIGGSLATDAWTHQGPSTASGIRWLERVRPTGEIERCERNTPCFTSTIGSWGLTGVITRAAIEHVPDGRVLFERRITSLDALESELDASRQRPDVARLHGIVSLAERTWFAEAAISTWTREEGSRPAFSTPLWSAPARTLLRGSADSAYRRDLRWRIERGIVPSLAAPSSVATAYNVRLASRENTRSEQTDTRVSLTIRRGELSSALAEVGTTLRSATDKAIDVEVFAWEPTPGTLLSRGPEGWIIVVTLAHAQEDAGSVRSLVAELRAVGIAHGGFGLEAWPPPTATQLREAYPDLGAFISQKQSLDPENRLRSNFWTALGRSTP